MVDVCSPPLPLLPCCFRFRLFSKEEFLSFIPAGSGEEDRGRVRTDTHLLRLMGKLLDREMGICSAEWGDGMGWDMLGV